MKVIALDHCRAGGHECVNDQSVGCSTPVGLRVLGGRVALFFTSMRNKEPELSLLLFVRLRVLIKQTNLNHLLLAVDPVLIGGLCNMEAEGISNLSIKYGLNPTRYIPRGMGLPKKKIQEK